VNAGPRRGGSAAAGRCPALARLAGAGTVDGWG